MPPYCSAGVGRTGTYIAIDHELDHASDDGAIDVLQCVYNMRQNRVDMVQNIVSCSCSETSLQRSSFKLQKIVQSNRS